MRPLLIVLAGACASVGTSLVVWAAVRFEEAPFVEVLDGGLVRTTATEQQVNFAVANVLQRVRSVTLSEEGDLLRSKYREEADAWFSSPDYFGHSAERASRLVREQLDRSGDSLRVEVLRGTDMPTLVFVEHQRPDTSCRLAQQVANELSQMGVVTR